MGWLKIYSYNDRIAVEEEGVRDIRYFNNMDYEIDDTMVYLRCHYHEFGKEYKVLFADLQKEDGSVVSDIPLYLSGLAKIKIDATIQSSTSPLVIANASNIVSETTISVATAIDDRTITVVDPTDAAIGQLASLYSVADNRVYFSRILAINGSVLTIDTPLDFAFPIGSVLSYATTDMSVDGSTTPVIFGFRNPTETDIAFSVDVTRMIVTFQTTSAGDYNEFGNIAALTNGLACRKVDGTYQNIFNVKSNRELDNLMYDFKFISASGSAPDGMSGRFTFEKLGSVVRVGKGEDLQFIVQDDLTGITKLEILLEGAGVTD